MIYITAQFWDVTSRDLEFVQAERQGVVYLRPMSELVAALADAQSVAVAGRRPDTGEINRVVKELTQADRTVGESLRVHDSWTALQTKIDQLQATPQVGKSAYSTYSETIDVALILMLRIGDTSNLILDPEIDSYYLMDAGMLRLPALIADSGRMLDLEVLRNQGTGKDLPLARVLVARDRVSTAASAVEAGLAKSFGASASGTIGKGFLDKIDAFQAAVEPLAPSTPLVEQPLPPSVELMRSDRSQLSQTALQLDTSTLNALDHLLGARQQDTEENRQGVALVLIICALLAGAAMWLRKGTRLFRGKPRPPGRTGGRRASGSADHQYAEQSDGDEHAGSHPDAGSPGPESNGRLARGSVADAAR
ncbi:hypothetical protein [Streptomyces sp. BK340]|uniref:hypothetical protein n=1 Tax=Streptomyces sp. BK340 TaxID=2572903 RepID=UPI0011A54AD9|nr:hypothetical protein [Streptomyces sp. BK340]TVZ90400.1 hypothetical protein FB157_11157 [Streptomyces sp. BK340]